MNPSELVKGCGWEFDKINNDKGTCGSRNEYCAICEARMEQALFMLNNYKWVIANHRIGNDIEILEKALNIYSPLSSEQDTREGQKSIGAQDVGALRTPEDINNQGVKE